MREQHAILAKVFSIAPCTQEQLAIAPSTNDSLRTPQLVGTGPLTACSCRIIGCGGFYIRWPLISDDRSQAADPHVFWSTLRAEKEVIAAPTLFSSLINGHYCCALSPPKSLQSLVSVGRRMHARYRVLHIISCLWNPSLLIAMTQQFLCDQRD